MPLAAMGIMMPRTIQTAIENGGAPCSPLSRVAVSNAAADVGRRTDLLRCCPGLSHVMFAR
jgi:hypothetical protein